jgi:ligand-binding SRPBCC domain-containing protein
VFDLARCVEVHLESAVGTKERAVAGVTSGLLELNDEITWEARHFGVRQRLSVRIAALDRPNHFQDVMLAGAFKKMVHDHYFVEHPQGTQMEDRFEFESPLGALGKAVDRVFLASYMRGFLLRRNQVLKQLAESTEWIHFLTDG